MRRDKIQDYAAPMQQGRGYQSLRRGRSSIPGASYFLTYNELHRRPLWDNAQFWCAFRAAVRTAESTNWGSLRVAVVMPDHLHLVMRLGNQGPLGKLVALMKTLTGNNSGEVRPVFQDGYFDRRLRPEKQILPVFLYIYRNPQAAGLVETPEAWPYFYCCEEDWTWFSTNLSKDVDYPEWLQDSE